MDQSKINLNQSPEECSLSDAEIWKILKQETVLFFNYHFAFKFD